MGTIKAVTPRRYAEKLTAHKAGIYNLPLYGWQVPILHGLVALATDHPEIKKMHEPTHQVIREGREWCKDICSHWGFTLEEVEYLDKMREAGGK